MFIKVFLVQLFCIITIQSSLIAQINNKVDHEQEEEYSEKIDDPYIPNQYDSKKLTPGYRFNNSGLRNSNGTVIITSQVNVNKDGMNIIGDAANEPSIAINIFNRNHLVIGWRQFDNVRSNFRQAGWGYSLDAGKTWTFPGVIEPQVFRSDPVLDSDINGRFYYNSLSNDFRCKVFKSDNNGLTWNQGVFIGGGDKQWMTIDKNSQDGLGHIYSSWAPSFTSCPPGFFTRSADHGESYEECTVLPERPSWGTMAVSKEGYLYQSGRCSKIDTIVVLKSLNAKDKASLITWDTPYYINIGGRLSSSTPINPQGLLGQVNIDIDRSDNDTSGHVYVLASVVRKTDPGDVMFSKSSDGGNTWSQSKKINDDNSEENYQWFGTMSVAPNGRIDVVWLDTRDAPTGSHNSALYYSYSIDRGETWSKNEKLSESFDPHIGYPNQKKMGDYFDMKSDDTGAHLAWAATFNGEEDVYYSYIIPDDSNSLIWQNHKDQYLIYPNPSSGRLFIETEENQTIVVIYSLSGQKIMSNVLEQHFNEINISSFKNGIYLIRLTGNNGVSITTKLIKE